MFENTRPKEPFVGTPCALHKVQQLQSMTTLADFSLFHTSRLTQLPFEINTSGQVMVRFKGLRTIFSN